MTQTYLIEISPADITESKENKSREESNEFFKMRSSVLIASFLVAFLQASRAVSEEQQDNAGNFIPKNNSIPLPQAPWLTQNKRQYG